MAADDLSDADIAMDSANLYREETFTDRRVGTLQVLTPITKTGATDTRPPGPLRRTDSSAYAGRRIAAVVRSAGEVARRRPSRNSASTRSVLSIERCGVSRSYAASRRRRSSCRDPVRCLRAGSAAVAAGWCASPTMDDVLAREARDPRGHRRLGRRERLGRLGQVRDRLARRRLDDGDLVPRAASEFQKARRSGFDRGVNIIHFQGATSVEVEGRRAIAQTKMTINQRATVDGVLVDAVCTGRSTTSSSSVRSAGRSCAGSRSTRRTGSTPSSPTRNSRSTATCSRDSRRATGTSAICKRRRGSTSSSAFRACADRKSRSFMRKARPGSPARRNPARHSRERP